jgi:hypothetical protein
MCSFVLIMHINSTCIRHLHLLCVATITTGASPYETKSTSLIAYIATPAHIYTGLPGVFPPDAYIIAGAIFTGVYINIYIYIYMHYFEVYVHAALVYMMCL